MDDESEFLNQLLHSPSRSDVELRFNDDDDNNFIATSSIDPNVGFAESSGMNLHTDVPHLQQRHQSFDGGGCSKPWKQSFDGSGSLEPWNSGGVLGFQEEQHEPGQFDLELRYIENDYNSSIAPSSINQNAGFDVSSGMNLHRDGPHLQQRNQIFDESGSSKPWNSSGRFGFQEEQYGPGQFDLELRYINKDNNNNLNATSSINPNVGYAESSGMNLQRDGPHLHQRNQSFDGSGNSKQWNSGEGFVESSGMNLHRDGPRSQQRNQSFNGIGSSKPWNSGGGFGCQEEQYGPSHTRSDMLMEDHCSKNLQNYPLAPVCEATTTITDGYRFQVQSNDHTYSREDCNLGRPRARARPGHMTDPHSISGSWEVNLHRDEPQSQQRNQNFDGRGSSKQWNSGGGFSFQEEPYGPGQSGVALRYINDDNNNSTVTKLINPNAGFVDSSGMNLYRDRPQSQQRNQTFDGSGSSKFGFQEEQYGLSQAQSNMLMENHGSKNLQDYSVAPAGEATTMADGQRFKAPQTDSRENCNPARPRARARRGQATDPHSIAERLRRERIADGIRHLQELLPNPIRSDKASFLGEMIDYVKSLQNQMKDLSLSCGAGDNLEKDGQSQDDTRTPDDAAFERELVGLMESNNMDKAMQLLQSRGIRLVPVSQASAITLPEGNKSGANSTPPDSDTCVRDPEAEPEDVRASQKRRGA